MSPARVWMQFSVSTKFPTVSPFTATPGRCCPLVDHQRRELIVQGLLSATFSVDRNNNDPYFSDYKSMTLIERIRCCLRHIMNIVGRKMRLVKRSIYKIIQRCPGFDVIHPLFLYSYTENKLYLFCWCSYSSSSYSISSCKIISVQTNIELGFP